jgi:pimeloyl-ACP methyl ester carboxylesterase
MRPIIILHGWSDTAKSFVNLAKWLKANGFQVVDIVLGDYLSLNDEITLYDLGVSFRNALIARNVPETQYAFDMIVHSTGGLVAREYLRQVCKGDATATPVRHLCMLAPANFGSPLATLGESIAGRVLKGWDWTHLGQSGKKILDALALASPYSWQLAEDDLFDPSFPIFAPHNTMTTVMVGTVPYPDPVKSIYYENGSDGTVRASTANLNAHRFTLDFTKPQTPVLTAKPRNSEPIAFAIFHRNHGNMPDPDETAPQHDLWARTLKDALTLETTGEYESHIQNCQAILESTYAEAVGSPNPDWYHRYEHVVFRVRDQFGGGLPDYMIEFYQEEGDPHDAVFVQMHKEILEKVTRNNTDPSYTSFLIDTTALQDYLAANTAVSVQLSVSVPNISERIGYQSPPGGVPVFTKANRRLIFPNEPVLVEVVISRVPTPEVFKLLTYPLVE